MTAAQLEAAIARTGHERLRWLTSDANPDAAQRAAYRDLVARLAEGDSPPPPDPAPDPPRADLSDARRALRLGRRRCWYAGPPACGCSGSHRCHALGRDATLRDCLDCLKDVT